ncbi:aldo/keto reductase [Tundrisphaera lichenicola]|uniref:aldo/keto reductase n=1 Tax=Tundrisphaera lichenicola TaxID=2029860 RepID=UPI003EBD2A94
MSNEPSQVQRREFLQAGALASAAAVSLGSPSLGDEPNASKTTLPTRKLGNTGVDVTILNQGTWRAPGALDRILRFSYANGVRYFDTAKSYGSEPGIAKWMQAVPEVRKNIFLVTKDSPRDPSQMMKMLDERLANLKTDYVDLFFIHALGDHHGADEAIAMAKSPELKQAIEAIKKSGKAKFVGFSTHHKNRAEIIESAAQGGFVDAIMLQYTAWLDKDAPLNKALDAAYKRGIGLISMKQVAGPEPEKFLAEVPKHVPGLQEKGLSPFQGLLHAIWSDERISTCCVSMRNLDQITENTVAARKFEPLKQAEIEGLHRAFMASHPSLCADCDGRCAKAGKTDAALGDLTRYLTYHERHGARSEARKLFAELPEAARDWKDADLAAAQAACPNHLNFAELLPKVERHLG